MEQQSVAESTVVRVNAALFKYLDGVCSGEAMNTIAPVLSLHSIKFGEKQLFATEEFFRTIAIQEGPTLPRAAVVEGLEP